MPSDSRREATGEDVASNTRSGRNATMVSTLGSSPPPTRGKARTDSGPFEYRSTPTSRSQRPSWHTISVSDGSRH
jgi:hypothetical protein